METGTHRMKTLILMFRRRITRYEGWRLLSWRWPWWVPQPSACGLEAVRKRPVRPLPDPRLRKSRPRSNRPSPELAPISSVSPVYPAWSVVRQVLGTQATRSSATFTLHRRGNSVFTTGLSNRPHRQANGGGTEFGNRTIATRRPFSCQAAPRNGALFTSVDGT